MPASFIRENLHRESQAGLPARDLPGQVQVLDQAYCQFYRLAQTFKLPGRVEFILDRMVGSALEEFGDVIAPRSEVFSGRKPNGRNAGLGEGKLVGTVKKPLVSESGVKPSSFYEAEEILRK